MLCWSDRQIGKIELREIKLINSIIKSKEGLLIRIDIMVLIGITLYVVFLLFILAFMYGAGNYRKNNNQHS
jgi:hypothetical protein